MEEIVEEITVHAPVERVYRLVADPEKQARFMEEQVLVRQVRMQRRPTPSGEEGHMEVDFLGRTMEADYRMFTRPPRSVRFEAHGDWEETGEAELEPVEEGTLLRVRGRYEFPGAMGRVLSGLGMDTRMTRRHLRRLKKEAEGD